MAILYRMGSKRLHEESIIKTYICDPKNAIFDIWGFRSWLFFILGDGKFHTQLDKIACKCSPSWQTNILWLIMVPEVLNNYNIKFSMSESIGLSIMDCESFCCFMLIANKRAI